MAGRLNKLDQTDIVGFEWDESKRIRVLSERGIDFVDAAKTLLGRVYEYASQRNEERRFAEIGPSTGGRLIAIIYTIRERRLRIITARPARKNEQRAYLHAISNSTDEGQD